MTMPPAMVFAAGFGTRMKDLTRTTPKALLEFNGQPLIDSTINLLREAGIERIVVNTHYLAEQLEEHLADMGVITVREKNILETGGGLKAALPQLESRFVITMNPDVVWYGPNPVKELLGSWEESMTGLLLLTLSGDIDCDFSLEQGQIQRHGAYRYTGLQAIRTDRLAEIEDEVFSLNRLWDLEMTRGPLHGVVYSGEWTDIGTRDALVAAQKQLKAR